MGEVQSAYASLDETTLPQALFWVKDAPLFIDDTNLPRFYDAVVRPPFKENASRTIKLTEAAKKELQAKLGASAKFGLPGWLASLFSASVEASGEGSAGRSDTETREDTITLEPITTPQRQLEQLTAFYLLQRLSRLLAGGPADTLAWQEQGASSAVPRALAFIDLPPATKLIPMAAEFDNGKVITLFDKLLAKSGERPPTFQDAKSLDYWRWFVDHYDTESPTFR